MSHLDKDARPVLRCHLCPANFYSRPGLYLHIKATHENRRNYSCTFCAKKFAVSFSLKCHVDARHPENKEIINFCDQCEYKSHSKYNLYKHKSPPYCESTPMLLLQKIFFQLSGFGQPLQSTAHAREVKIEKCVFMVILASIKTYAFFGVWMHVIMKYWNRYMNAT